MAGRLHCIFKTHSAKAAFKGRYDALPALQ